MKNTIFFSIAFLLFFTLFVSQTVQAQGWSQNATSIWTNPTTKNVGIGTTTPASKLDIAAQNALRINGFEPFLTLVDNNSQQSARIQAAHGDINFFKLTANQTVVPQLIIKDNGNVGIQTSNPEYPLDVNGWGRIRGSDFMLGTHDGRPQKAKLSNRALAHFPWGNAANDNLVINFGGDFEDGVVVDGPGLMVGATRLPAGYRLAVGGRVICEELKVQLGGQWPDYVFTDDYKLPSLDEVEKFIEKENHLPGIPAAAEVEANGLEVGDMQRKMMEKIEELTLYLVEMNKENKSLRQRVEQLEQH